VSEEHKRAMLIFEELLDYYATAQRFVDEARSSNPNLSEANRTRRIALFRQRMRWALGIDEEPQR
jgi:hypothetical protein